MTVPGKTTLGLVRQMVRRRADMLAAQFVTDTELNAYINASHRALRDLLCQAFGNDYFATSYSFTTDGSSDTYALPDDFYKLLGVDLLVSGTEYISLQPFNFNERNRFSGIGSTAYGDRTSIRYRLRANTLWLTPRASSGLTVRIWYIPRATALVDGAMNSDGSGTITVNGIVAGDEIVATSGVTSATLTADTDFDVGATDDETAVNLAAAITSQLSGISVTAAANGPVVVVTVPNGTTVTWTPTTTARFIPGSDSSDLDGVQGWEEFVVVDSAIKCKDKEESDTSVLLADMARLTARIDAASENRDAGEAATVTDVYATRFNSRDI